MNQAHLISFLLLLLLLLSSCYAEIPDDRWKRQLFNEQIPKVRPLTGYLQQMHTKQRNDSTPTPQQQSTTTTAPQVDVSAGEVQVFGHPHNNNNIILYDKNQNNKNNNINSIVHFNTINSNSYSNKPLHSSKYNYQDLSKIFYYWHHGNKPLNYPFSYSWSFRE